MIKLAVSMTPRIREPHKNLVLRAPYLSFLKFHHNTQYFIGTILLNLANDRLCSPSFTASAYQPLKKSVVTIMTLNLMKLSYHDRVCICNWTSPVNQSLAPWLYWCRSVWYKNVLTTVGCDTSWAKVGTIRFHWANYMVNPWGIQEKIYHSNSRGTRQFHGLAPWLEFPYVKMTLRSLQNLIFRDYTSINEITLKTFSRWKITPIR